MKRLGTKLILIGNSKPDHLILEPLASQSSEWRLVNIFIRCGSWTGRYLAQANKRDCHGNAMPTMTLFPTKKPKTSRRIPAFR
jgi:hypothetical protein